MAFFSFRHTDDNIAIIIPFMKITDRIERLEKQIFEDLLKLYDMKKQMLRQSIKEDIKKLNTQDLIIHKMFESMICKKRNTLGVIDYEMHALKDNNNYLMPRVEVLEKLFEELDTKIKKRFFKCISDLKIIEKIYEFDRMHNQQ